jgi:tRNA pseudouridine13 synthase
VTGAWLDIALHPPLAFGEPPGSGRLRSEPEDFAVTERLGFAPDGGSAHLLLEVEKRAANTLWVARELARHAGVRSEDAGFAGLKDRRAVATQWFTVPATRPLAEWVGHRGEGYEVKAAHAHSRKLRRGALAGNGFRIVVRSLAGDGAAIEARIRQVAAAGVPNYFGPQRFGREGANVLAVADWLATGRLPRERDGRSFVLSAARSLAFNRVLGERVKAGTWDHLLPGEIVNLDGSGSVFLAESIDDTLRARLAAFDVHPTGPMPGRGGRQPAGEALAVESAALDALPGVAAALAGAGVDAERRALRLRPPALRHQFEGDSLVLEFDLPRGAFATAVLREIIAFASAGPEAFMEQES